MEKDEKHKRQRVNTRKLRKVFPLLVGVAALIVFFVFCVVGIRFQQVFPINRISTYSVKLIKKTSADDEISSAAIPPIDASGLLKELSDARLRVHGAYSMVDNNREKVYHFVLFDDEGCQVAEFLYSESSLYSGHIAYRTTTHEAKIIEQYAEAATQSCHSLGLDDSEPIIANAPKDCHTMYCLNNPECYSPTEAAQILAVDFIEGLKNQKDLSFSVTDYRKLSVRVYSTTDVTVQSMYHLQDEEVSKNNWIVEIDVEFKYEGVISPIGPSCGQWCTSLIQGGPVGFLLVRTSSEYTFQVRR